MVNRIYPSELQLNKANVSDTEASFLNLHFSLSDGFVKAKIYDFFLMGSSSPTPIPFFFFFFFPLLFFFFFILHEIPKFQNNIICRVVIPEKDKLKSEKLK